MIIVIGADTAKLAGPQINLLLQKICNGEVTPNHLEWFNKLTREERELFYNRAYVCTAVTIDRTQPFDPVKFLGQGWTIDEQDERALALNKIDLTEVKLEHMLKKWEHRIKGEKKLKRLKKAGHIRLDAKVFQTLWENQALIPKSWMTKTNGKTTLVFFDGTILRHPTNGYRYVLYLWWNFGKWNYSRRWLEGKWGSDNPSAVLTSI